MKKSVFAIIPLLALSGCLGNSSSDNEIMGQVKKAQHVTPMILPDYDRVDVSLGVIRNGIGSMSKEDMLLYVPNASDFAVLKRAAETGDLVKITYSQARATLYVEKDYVTHAEIAR